jgi:hypothetical protein
MLKAVVEIHRKSNLVLTRNIIITVGPTARVFLVLLHIYKHTTSMQEGYLLYI